VSTLSIIPEGIIMKRIVGPLLLLGALLCLTFAFPAAAQVYTVDYLGFGWETGGVLPSNAGDELVMTCAANNLDPAFGVDLGSEELTLYIHGLISAGQVDAGGYWTIAYTGGTMEIYEDPAQNADWGTNPPNAVSPSTFSDGSLFFSGTFTDFSMAFTADGGTGTFSGHLDGVGGSILGGMCSDCVFTWGGSFTQVGGAQIPEGYDLQIDGTFQIDSAVPTAPSSWSSVKALFK
jgi:hypothetical protein